MGPAGRLACFVPLHRPAIDPGPCGAGGLGEVSPQPTGGVAHCSRNDHQQLLCIQPLSTKCCAQRFTCIISSSSVPRGGRCQRDLWGRDTLDLWPAVFQPAQGRTSWPMVRPLSAASRQQYPLPLQQAVQSQEERPRPSSAWPSTTDTYEQLLCPRCSAGRWGPTSELENMLQNRPVLSHRAGARTEVCLGTAETLRQGQQVPSPAQLPGGEST